MARLFIARPAGGGALWYRVVVAGRPGGMMRADQWGLVASFLMISQVACEGGDKSEDSGGSAWVQAEGWPAGVWALPMGNSGPGDLADGQSIALEWAWESDVACFPGTEDMNFKGPHQFFAFDQPENSVLTVTATPDDGVDLSVYLLQFGVGSGQVPPEVSAAVTCEAGFDQTNDSNPGVAESASVTATTNPYQVLVGVAGAQGVSSGGFSLRVDLAQ